MSTILAPFPTLQRDPSSLKRKAELLSNLPTDLVALHVKRARTSSFGTDVHSSSGYKTFVPTLVTPSLTVTLASDCTEEKVEGTLANPLNTSSGLILGTIAAIASSEFSLFSSSEINRDCLMKAPPPTTSAKGPSAEKNLVQESVCSTPPTTPTSQRSEDEGSVDLYLDLDIDPESEELDEVNDEMWATALLFFIGKQPRDKKKDVRQPPASPRASAPEPSYDSPTQLSKFGAKDKKCKKLKRRRGHFPKATTDLLKRWLFEHMDHPYPTEDEKLLAEDTGLSVKQINYWFTNSRRRFLKPKNE